MRKNIRNIGICTVVAVWILLTVIAWFHPAKSISQSERRPLQQMPEFSADKFLDGSLARDFESYTLDQFPLREDFRTLKALYAYNVLQMKDNNGIYLEDGYAAKLEYPLNQASISNALKKFNVIYHRYLKDHHDHIYVSVIPDKGYYLASENGYPTMDYEDLFRQVAEGMPWAQMIDITGGLDISHYYRTDTHWRQEKLVPVARILSRAMGVTPPEEGNFTAVPVTGAFYGVYHGQAALPMGGEELLVMENAMLSACRVYYWETGEYKGIYDREKLSGLDPYDVFLSGPQSVLTIENPNADPNRELVIFRDSFASALAPLLTEGYGKITLVDIRYVSSDLLEEYLPAQNADVLFLYSTLILNNSTTLK
ncbi:MAG: hypothetical protein IKK11_08465 [Oscillospiraceae bacterium]|nr:hypothetical protein [Oscillospiraceae bacterium]